MESEKNSKKIKKRKLYEYDDTCENEPVLKRRKLSVNEIHCKLNTLFESNKSLKKQNYKLTQENKLIKHCKKGLNLYKKESNKWKSKYMQLYSQLSVLTNTNITNNHTNTNTNTNNNNQSIPLHSYNINFDESSNTNRKKSNINKYKSKHNNSNNNIISSDVMVNRSYKIRSKKSLYKEPKKSIQCVTNGTKKSNESNHTLELQSKGREVNGNNKNKKQYYDRNDPKTWRKCNKGHGLLYYSRSDLKGVYGTYGVCDNIDCKLPLYTGGYHCNICNWDICKKCWKDANGNEDDDYIP